MLTKYTSTVTVKVKPQGYAYHVIYTATVFGVCLTVSGFVFT